MKSQLHQIIPAATLLIVTLTPLRAQIVADGANRTLINVTTNFIGDVTVGTNGSFTLLVLSDNALLTNSALGVIGRNATAKSNEVRLVSATARWRMGSSLFVGLNGAANRLTVSNGGVVQANVGDVGVAVSSSNNVAMVTGSGSLWSNANELVLGFGSAGNQLVISNGGMVRNGVGFVGSDANASNNLAVVTDPGSVWLNSAALNIGFSGATRSQVQVSNGGLVVSSDLFVGFNSASVNNRVMVDGGTLRVTNAAATCVLDVRRGTNVLNAGLVEVDRLLLTNVAGVFEFNGGTLSARSTIVNNGQPFRVGNGIRPAAFNLTGNGSHSFPNGLTISAFATLLGNGAVSGPLAVQPAGVFAPGASIGKIILSNTPSLQGEIRMEISKNGAVTTNDQIEVTGVLALGTITYGGSLSVTNIGTNGLAPGDRFQLFNAATYNGSFLAVSLPPLSPELCWLDYLLVDGSIEVAVATPPVVQTLPASAIGTYTATLNGVANPNGSSTTGRFEFGISTNYGDVTSPQVLGSGASNTNFSHVLTGLFGGVTYHFRAVASNDLGAVFGNDQSFGPFPAFTDIVAGLPGVDGSQQDFFYSSGFTAWGDYDNDNRLDILLAGQGILQVWRNTGAGFTNSGATPSSPLYGCSAAWGDLNNDGRLDFVVTGKDENAFGPIALVCRNTGNGFIEINTTNNAPLLGVHAGAAVLGDYDNDGLLDVLMTGATFGFNASTEVWRNVGNGWSSINAGLTPAANSSAAWGDYDNDGRLDLMLNPSGIWRNTGSGFTNVSVGVTGVSHGSVAWGDYDNDGRLDLLQTGSPLANSSGAISRVWRNTGNGFTNINAGLPGVFRGAAAWGDYDNDGRLDILLAGTTNDNILGNLAQLWRNTGNGFTNSNVALPEVSRSSVAWGDYDNDGRLDILIAGVDGAVDRISQVWRNRTPITNTPPSAPTGLSVSAAGTTAILSWNASADAQTPASGLTYNVRIGTAPGASDIMGPMASSSGLRRLPQMGNAQLGLTLSFKYTLETAYYWSVQAVDTAFAGSAFSAESSFKILQLPQPDPLVVAADSTNLLNGDLNGDGNFDENELQYLLADFFAASPFLQMTNLAGLGGTNVTFALTNSLVGAFSVEYTTNLVDWYFLGPATPRYLFTDTNAPTLLQRYYRLRWP